MLYEKNDIRNNKTDIKKNKKKEKEKRKSKKRKKKKKGNAAYSFLVIASHKPG